ncbi:MAG TPA: acyl-CoA dehydrogenase family protein [Microthrixaceae bacterium]|nr:acyl-CoA dehydrogenase family protein [Microthrixaceae bacterium]
MDFSFSPELQALSDEACRVARETTSTLDVTEDSWLRGVDADFPQILASHGWLGMCLPTEWGGGGRPAIERFAVVEALISEGAPIATAWFADRQIGPTLLQFGTDEQRHRFLPDIIAGTSKWCVGMSEPDAGSDVASLRTRADRDGDHWVLNGQKVWTSGAAESDWCYVIARTDPDAAPHAGLSEFIVDLHSPGVEIRTIHDMSDDRHFCEVHFSDVRVPADLQVGTLNGAFKQIMRQMEHERGGIDRLVSNRRLYLDAVESARTTGRLASDPLLRQEYARLEGGYRIGRSLVLREVLGQAPPGYSAVTKTWCTEFEQRVADFCVSIAGPDAMIWGRTARNICYAPGYTIMGGTTQILRNIIGERILGLPR